MILIEHKNDLVTSSLYNGENIIVAIHKMAQEYPQEYLLVHKKGIDTPFFRSEIKDLIKPYIIISSHHILHEDIGYVEDSPFMVVSSLNKYPTWMKSDAIFAIHTSLINQFAVQINIKTSLLYWLNSVSKLTRPLGILHYQLPLESSKGSYFDLKSLYRFVKQHYKGRWIFILLCCHLWYEKRFPVYAFAKALFYKNRSLELNVASLQNSKSALVKDALNYDVVIPTMGRATYLKYVLEDLNIQQILPKSVIILEQNPDLSSVSELDDLKKKDWNFKIIHEFTHITGACRARNEGLKKTIAPWVLLFDDDVRIQPDFSSKTQDFLNQTNSKCVTFACLQKGEEEHQENFKQWESFGSGCSIVHRDVLEKCSFDMALEHGYGEDVDFGMQVRNAGFDVTYAPQIQILHLKAPVGGFRKLYVFPWEKDEVQPKPSPQIMYHRKKNYTHKQLLGYKMVQFFKTYGVFGTKLPWKHYKRYEQAWTQSEKWANKL